MVSELSFVNFMITIFLMCGIMSCIPVVVATLTWFNLIKSSWLTMYWKHIVVMAMTISAIISPGADILSMLFFALPILILFALSIIVSIIIEKLNNPKVMKQCLEQQNCL